MVGVWLIFVTSIALLLAVDLGIFHKSAREVQLREALVLTAIWMSLGVAFSSVVYVVYEFRFVSADAATGTSYSGMQAALHYLTAYFIEQSLSFDNIFVIALIFDRFRVAPHLRHRVLFWGVLGAVVIRGVLITSGLWLVTHLSWLFYVFGAYLVYMGITLVFKKEQDLREDEEEEELRIVRFAKRWLPMADGEHGERFMVKIAGKRYLTPLALVLVTIEWTDVVFAVDSIPAVLAISTETFIIYTSNIFAILGLRSLYFVLSNLMHRFTHLKWSLAAILVFVGLKMTLHTWVHIPNLVSLGFVLVAMVVGVGLSLRGSDQPAAQS